MRDNAPCHSSDLFGTNEIGPRALFLNSGQHDSSTCTNAAPWTCGYAIAYWAALLSQPSYSRHHMSHTAGLRNISIPMCLLEAPELVLAFTLFRVTRRSPRMWGRLLVDYYSTRKD